MAIKWKRGSEPGVYTSGTLVIKGAKFDWALYESSGGKLELIKSMSSKRSCQEYAEGLVGGGSSASRNEAPMSESEELEPEPRPAGRHFAAQGSLESVLASLRLEIGRLTDMVGLLATKIDKLR